VLEIIWSRFLMPMALLLFFSGCANYYDTSYIRIKQEAPKEYRVYFGSQEAIKYGFDDTPLLRGVLEEKMRELGYCDNGFRFVPDTLTGAGAFQPSFLIECP
jgi:hypothetical protein